MTILAAFVLCSLGALAGLTAALAFSRAVLYSNMLHELDEVARAAAGLPVPPPERPRTRPLPTQHDPTCTSRGTRPERDIRRAHATCESLESAIGAATSS